MNYPPTTKKPAVLLVYANPAEGELTDCLGTASIIAFLKSKGIRAQQFRSRPLDTLRQTVNSILASGATIIGFTFYNTNYYFIKTLSRKLKERAPGIHLLAGGPTATFSDEIILHNIPEIDICVRGDGESATQEIVEHFHHGRELNTILGISYRSGSNVRRTPDRPLVDRGQSTYNCLDRFPSAYLCKVLDPRRFVEHGDYIPLITSRGCVFMCSYCSCAAISNHTIRHHSPQRIIAELKSISDHFQGRKAAVMIHDDCFTINKKRIYEICEGILKNDIKLEFSIFTRADFVDPRMLKLLYRCGVRRIGFGLESAHPATLYRVGKIRRSSDSGNGIRREREFIATLKRSVQQARSIGFEVYTSIIAGLPGESIKDITSTFRLAKQLKSYCYYNYLRLIPGTQLFKDAAGTGPHHSERWLHLPHDVLPDTLPDKQMRRLPLISNSNRAEIKQTSSRAIAAFFMGLAHQATKDPLPPAYYINNRQRIRLPLLEKVPLASLLLFSRYPNRSSETTTQTTHIRMVHATSAYTITRNRSYVNYTLIDRYYFIPPIVLRDTKGQSLLTALFRKADDQIRIVNIDSNALAEQFEKLLKNIHQLSRRMLEHNTGRVIVRDACRWSSTCPARTAKRFIVRKGCSVSCCFHGKSLGKLGDPTSTLQKNYNRHLKATQKKRGCATCPVRDKCSQCPFLGHMHARVFCSLKRKDNERIAAFISLLELRIGSLPAA